MFFFFLLHILSCIKIALPKSHESLMLGIPAASIVGDRG